MPQTREQEELEELLLLEQQSNEQRRLEVLQEEQRQLQTKRKNKQALLDELVRNAEVSWSFSLYHTQMHPRAHTPCARGFMAVRSLGDYY